GPAGHRPRAEAGAEAQMGAGLPEREPREALYAHLKADPGVQAAVGDRVYQRRVPSGAVKPLIVIFPPESRTAERELGGVAYWEAALQVTAMAAATPAAEAAAKAVMQAVEGFQGVMAGAVYVIDARVDSDQQIDQDDVDEIHHHVDVVVRYKDVE